VTKITYVINVREGQNRQEIQEELTQKFNNSLQVGEHPEGFTLSFESTKPKGSLELAVLTTQMVFTIQGLALDNAIAKGMSEMPWSLVREEISEE